MPCPINPLPGYQFNAHYPYAHECCKVEMPELIGTPAGGQVACHAHSDSAGGVGAQVESQTLALVRLVEVCWPTRRANARVLSLRQLPVSENPPVPVRLEPRCAELRCSNRQGQNCDLCCSFMCSHANEHSSCHIAVEIPGAEKRMSNLEAASPTWPCKRSAIPLRRRAPRAGSQNSPAPNQRRIAGIISPPIIWSTQRSQMPPCR